MSGIVRSQEVGDTMGIEETAETWVRVDLFCDGLGNDATCLFGAGDEPERISDVAPIQRGHRRQYSTRPLKRGGASIQNCSVGYVPTVFAPAKHQSNPKTSWRAMVRHPFHKRVAS